MKFKDEWYENNDSCHMIVLVIDDGGLPIFEYPKLESEFKSIETDDNILISGLFSAINTFGKKVLGEEVQQMVFGSLYLSFSRDKWDHLYVFLFKEPPQVHALVQQLHLEMMALFNAKIKPILHLNPHLKDSYIVKRADTDMYKSIMEPFFKIWKKRFTC